MTTPVAPEHIFAGERVELLAHYEPDGAATVQFELALLSGQVIDVARVEADASPARLEWSVALPPGTKFPTQVVFTSALVGNPDKTTSRTLDVHWPVRTAIWAAHALAIPGVIEKLIDETMVPDLGLSFLDEISSMTGIRNDPTDPNKVQWDTRVPNGLGGDNVKRRARFKQIIDYAHARAISMLIGFEAVDTGTTPSDESTAFMTFVRGAVHKNGKVEVVQANARGEQVCKPKLDVVRAFGDRIVEFMFGPEHGLPWDGINFDLEIGALGPRYRPVIRALFHHLHDHPKMKGKWVAYATFGFTGYLKGRNGAPVSHAFQKVQTFQMAAGKPRMIARPMLYEEQVDPAHLKAVIDYAFAPLAQGGAGMQRQQLQLGIQGDLQPSQAPRPGKLTDNSEVIPLITSLFRPEATGLIYFMLFGGSKKVDTARMQFFGRISEAYRTGT